MASLEAFKRGDEVLSKFPDGSIMTVLAAKGLKVRVVQTTKTHSIGLIPYAGTI